MSHSPQTPPSVFGQPLQQRTLAGQEALQAVGVAAVYRNGQGHAGRGATQHAARQFQPVGQAAPTLDARR